MRRTRVQLICAAAVVAAVLASTLAYHLVAAAPFAAQSADSTSCSQGAEAGPTPDESGIDRSQASLLVPLAPSDLAAAAEQDGVVLSWLGTGEGFVQQYDVSRSMAGTDSWLAIGSVAPIGENRGTYRFIDAGADAGVSYVYHVVAVSSYDTTRKSEAVAVGPIAAP